MKHNLIFSIYIFFIITLPIMIIASYLLLIPMSISIWYFFILSVIFATTTNLAEYFTNKSVDKAFNKFSDEVDLYMDIYKGLSDDNEDHQIKSNALLIHNLISVINNLDKYMKTHILFLNKENWIRFQFLKSEIKNKIKDISTK